MPKIIVAYDGTPHADDALALGRSLAKLLGAHVALAHVHRADPIHRSPSAAVRGREEFLRRQGEAVLSRTSEDGAGLARHAIAGSTTASALRQLAADENAELIVFGSAYDGPHDHVHPGSAARRLLQSAHCAIAVAPDGFRDRVPSGQLVTAFAHDDERGSARHTAEALAAHAGGTVGEDAREQSDLLVLGSRAAGPDGRVMTSAPADRLIRAARGPVLVLPYGTALGAGGSASARAA